MGIRIRNEAVWWVSDIELDVSGVEVEEEKEVKRSGVWIKWKIGSREWDAVERKRMESGMSGI